MYTSFTIMFHWNWFPILKSDFFVVISVELLVNFCRCAKIVFTIFAYGCEVFVKYSSWRITKCDFVLVKKKIRRSKGFSVCYCMTIHVITFPRFSVWRQKCSFILITKRLSCVLREYLFFLHWYFCRSTKKYYLPWCYFYCPLSPTLLTWLRMEVTFKVCLH